MLRDRSMRKGKRQRFYARNAANTTLPWRLGVLMRSFSAHPANSHYPTQIHPALTSFADEVCATLARLLAYVGTLALLGILGVHFWDLWDAAGGVAEPSVKASWSQPAAHILLLPLVRSIRQRKQRLISSFGIPKAAARISSAGPARMKNLSLSSKSIVRAGNSTRRSPLPPTSGG
jgi:hypothetical protein